VQFCNAEGDLCVAKVCRKSFVTFSVYIAHCHVYIDDDVTHLRQDRIKYALAGRTISHVCKFNEK
jgi:hypothetical protein